jgi:hypothetical protein
LSNILGGVIEEKSPASFGHVQGTYDFLGRNRVPRAWIASSLTIAKALIPMSDWCGSV